MNQSRSDTITSQASSISASSQYVPGRGYRAPSCPVSPISNFSRPSSAVPPLPTLPESSTQAPSLPLPADLDSAINFDDSYGYATDPKQVPAVNYTPRSSVQPTYHKNAYRESEDFDSHEVAGGFGQRRQNAHVKSMAASAHDYSSLCSPRIDFVREYDEPEWWGRGSVEIPQPLKPTPPPKPTKPAPQQPSKAQFHKPTYTAGSLDRTFAFPSPRRVPTFPSPRVPSEVSIPRPASSSPPHIPMFATS
ncbi:uncharacterized protein AB675_3620 [Cyphellophora attinorum]|uniref:Uncharacterized protein n=1 Tax=Cyphellophora attinorum TaxID=1664694 RepID=A0A0N1H5I4_9EURO|nr:uncharacterized protein AB675_3620 [Phialophora attinorum]KPI37034.1 hypothetical protein AB675_3620 [Phialophora attinorum]